MRRRVRFRVSLKARRPIHRRSITLLVLPTDASEMSIRTAGTPRMVPSSFFTAGSFFEASIFQALQRVRIRVRVRVRVRIRVRVRGRKMIVARSILGTFKPISSSREKLYLESPTAFESGLGLGSSSKEKLYLERSEWAVSGKTVRCSELDSGLDLGLGKPFLAEWFDVCLRALGRLRWLGKRPPRPSIMVRVRIEG